MHKLAMQFAKHCESAFDLSTQSDYGYRSLSVCLLDCVYSLRARYYDVTVPLVERYAAMYMNGDSHASGDTVSMLLRRMDERGHKAFADDVLINHQKLGGARSRFQKKRYAISMPDICRCCTLKPLRTSKILNPRRFWRSSFVRSMG